MRLMTSVDVVAIPSTWDENHPVVAVEAGIARRPLLVADRGGLMELVTQGRDGWLVLSGDVEAWGERLAMLAAIPGVARAASAKVRRPHSADQMAAAFETVWIRAASDRRPSV